MINNRNEIKISFDEPKYHIDRANKVVVCVLKGTVNYPASIDYTTGTITKFNYADFDNVTVKAIAKLSPGDEFDENIGMKVALAKAESKAYEKVCTNLKEYMRNISIIIEQCKDFFYKSANVIEHNDEYIKQF